MNIKNIHIVISIMVVASFYTVVKAEPNDEEALRMIRAMARPRDKNKTPSSPDFIEHGSKRWLDLNSRNFYRKRIYFGKLLSGEPHYARIMEHEKNPNFNKVRLVILQKASLASYLLSYILPFLKIDTRDYFEVVGTYGDQDAREKLIQSIKGVGGRWCPNEQNPEQGFFVGGAGAENKDVCNAFEEFEKQVRSEVKKVKKF